MEMGLIRILLKAKASVWVNKQTRTITPRSKQWTGSTLKAQSDGQSFRPPCIIATIVTFAESL